MPSVPLALELDGWNVADGGVQPGGVPPVDPRQGCQLDVFDRAPRAPVEDELTLVEPDDRLGQGVVVAVSLGADGSDRAGLGQTLVYTMARYCTPRSLWWTSPSRGSRLAQMAISRASRARLVRRVRSTRQPTIRREKTSMTKAAYAKPDQVAT